MRFGDKSIGSRMRSCCWMQKIPCCRDKGRHRWCRRGRERFGRRKLLAYFRVLFIIFHVHDRNDPLSSKNDKKNLGFSLYCYVKICMRTGFVVGSVFFLKSSFRGRVYLVSCLFSLSS